MKIIESLYNGCIIETVSHPSLRQYYEVFGMDGNYYGMFKEMSDAKKRIDKLNKEKTAS